MKKWMWAALLALALALGGCQVQAPQEAGEEATLERAKTTKAPVTDIGEVGLKDDAALYDYDPTDVVCFYVTVRKGNAADETDHTLEQVNAYKNLQGMTGVKKIKAEAIFQVGDENGPLPGEVGYDALGPNATINVRGRTSTGYPQKSYRISLFDSAGLWRGQRAIALNKHPGDPTRLRNMLYFQLLQGVPGMTSLRTQFVHLYVKDETDPDAPDAFEDFGLYTQVELPNGRYLRNHGLSRDGNLYKANMCEMQRYPDQLRLATDPLYDLNAFSEVLEPKTGNDHQKLLNMLDAVNDYSIPIEQVIEKHFDLDNLTSYLAFNILMANPDSDAQNYLLYSPVNSDTWYYICWDGDGCLAYSEDELLGNAWAEGEWTRGISNYWGVVLFNRMLRVDGYRQALIDKVEALREQITPSRIAALIARYRTVVDAYTTRMPDAINMRVDTGKLENIYQNLPYDTDKAYEYFLESLTKPLPFYLADVEAGEGGLSFAWDQAYDFGDGLVQYDLEVATGWTFEGDVVYRARDLLSSRAVSPMLEPGDYYWRVVARNERGGTRGAFDQVSTDSGNHTGMRRFSVGADGTVTNYQ